MTSSATWNAVRGQIVLVALLLALALAGLVVALSSGAGGGGGHLAGGPRVMSSFVSRSSIG